MKVPREFGTEDPLRHLGWLVVCGVKVGDSRDKQREALMYLRSLIDKKLQEFGGEKGHTGCAEEAVDGLPSPSPSPTGERESLSRAATKANDPLLPASPASLDDEGQRTGASDGHHVFAPSSTPFPTSEQRAAAERADAARLAKSVPRAAQSLSMQALKIHGVAIAEMWHSQANDIIATNWWHNQILVELRKIKLPHGKNDARFGDYVTPGQWASIVNKVGKQPNAA